MESELFSALNALDTVLDRVLIEKILEKKLLEAQLKGEIILTRILERKLRQHRSELGAARLAAAKKVDLLLVQLDS